jgi:hypothetical protein
VDTRTAPEVWAREGEAHPVPQMVQRALAAPTPVLLARSLALVVSAVGAAQQEWTAVVSAVEAAQQEWTAVVSAGGAAQQGWAARRATRDLVSGRVRTLLPFVARSCVETACETGA